MGRRASVTAGVELQAQLLQRIGQPEDIANRALFLASDESAWITGTSMLVDGGFMARAHSFGRMTTDMWARPRERAIDAVVLPPSQARAIAFDREAREKDHQNAFKPYNATCSLLICDSPASQAGVISGDTRAVPRQHKFDRKA